MFYHWAFGLFIQPLDRNVDHLPVSEAAHEWWSSSWPTNRKKKPSFDTLKPLKAYWQHHVHFICSAWAAREVAAKPACGIARRTTERTCLLWVCCIPYPGFGPLWFLKWSSNESYFSCPFVAWWFVQWWKLMDVALDSKVLSWSHMFVNPVIDPTLIWNQMLRIDRARIRRVRKSHLDRDHSENQTESDESEGKPGSHKK